MNCKQIDLVAFHFGTLSAEERTETETHLVECKACLQDFLAFKREVETAASVARPSDDARARLRKAVVREIRGEPVVRPWAWWERPLAFGFASAAVFVPRFDSWLVFWQLGGRPALYLIAVGSLGALLRKSWRNGWRTVHMLNYVACLLGTVHAVLIGTDFGQPFLRLVPITMALVAVGVFIRKRLGQRRAKLRRRR